MPVCLAVIRNQYSALTRIERQIADYVLSNSDAVVGMSPSLPPLPGQQAPR